IEVSVDPVNDCQLDCFYCNSKTPKSRKVKMTDKHLIELAHFFKDWKVKAVCIAGGGEPTLHEGLGDFMWELKKLDVPVALITNGLFHDSFQIRDIAQTAQWVGVSVDAATPETYRQMKGHDRFKDVIRGISTLVEQHAREVTYKFLITPRNQYEIYDAIRTAVHLGCHAIHIRPVSQRNYQQHEEPFDIHRVNLQIDEGFKEYGDRVKIFAVRHKYNEKMHVDFPFEKCRVTPIMPIFSANSDVELCIDRKGDERLVLCKHDHVEEVLKVWSSEYHKALIDKINLVECPKCTLNYANSIIENVVIEDSMCWRFP
ncbi:hypothetical protein LCGC14_2796780, partial [marine sediment metagenome]